MTNDSTHNRQYSKSGKVSKATNNQVEIIDLLSQSTTQSSSDADAHLSRTEDDVEIVANIGTEDDDDEIAVTTGQTDATHDSTSDENDMEWVYEQERAEINRVTRIRSSGGMSSHMNSIPFSISQLISSIESILPKKLMEPPQVRLSEAVVNQQCKLSVNSMKVVFPSHPWGWMRWI